MVIGRRGNTRNLGLEKADIDFDTVTGLVKVDEFQNTNINGVYAVGDVADDLSARTPTATMTGKILAERLFNNKPEAKMDFSQIPFVMFTLPPMSRCGMTEQEAKS